MIWIIALFVTAVFLLGAALLTAHKERVTFGALALAIFGLTPVVSALYLSPVYNVWAQKLSGQAELARAEQNRQIRIQEAKSKMEAAKFEAQSEVERAHGIQQANKIIADGLGGAEGYLRYLFIDSLKEARGEGAQIIYVPTEAGLPILEAGRK